MNNQDVFQDMEKRWPSAVVARREVSIFTGGLIKPKFLANQDSLGTGPAERVEVCGRIGYPVSSLIEWLKKRSQTTQKGDRNE